MRTAWPARAVRDPLGSAPDRRQPARDPPPGPGRRPSAPGRPLPRRHSHRLRHGRDPVRHPATALDQPRHAAHARSSGAPPPTSPSQRRSAALGLPITRPSALRSGPIGLHHGPGDHLADRPAARRAAHGRSPRRLATAQGPPAGAGGTPAQFPAHPKTRGPSAPHTIDGFRILGSGLELELKIGLGAHRSGCRRKRSGTFGYRGIGRWTRRVEASRGTRN